METRQINNKCEDSGKEERSYVKGMGYGKGRDKGLLRWRSKKKGKQERRETEM